MLDPTDVLMLLVYHDGLREPLSTLLDPALYPRYRAITQRLAASHGDALDALTGADGEDWRALTLCAAHMIRTILANTTTTE